MGADFIYAITPVFKMTPERRKAAMEHIEQAYNSRASDSDGEYIKNGAEAAIERYEDFSESRETSQLELAGCFVFITGGLSWGDSPTEAYDHFNAIGECPGLYELLEKWSKEDHQ